MKTVPKLSLLTLTILLVGCNEKVSPELLQSNSTTPDTGTPTAPEEYYFGVENSSPTRLNYRLHKTGAGNGAATCEVRNTTGFSSDIFRGAPAINDITCFYEAEELALLKNGFEFSIKASKNTCDYVGYSPFGFYDRIPGDSTATYYETECANETTGPSNVATAAGLAGINIAASNGAMGCGDMVIDEATIPVGTRQKFVVQDDQDLCAFDYTANEGPNCDIGEITINTLTVTYTPPTADAGEVLSYERSTRTVLCGGKVAACVEGPTKKIDPEVTSVTEIQDTVLNTNFDYKYSYEPLIGRTQSLKSYANFRRNLSTKNIQYGTTLNAEAEPYLDFWGDNTYGKTFDPQVVDYFSNNLMMDNVTPLVSTAEIDAFAIRNNRTYAKPLAADPFLGIENRINPFYTFYCFDTAMEIKARIKMVVREWDRIYSTQTSDLEYLSDLWLHDQARQDSPFYVELPDDNDSYIRFNDKRDWDDMIPMERSAGAFNAASTTWKPTPTIPYPSGWFNPSYFTRGEVIP